MKVLLGVTGCIGAYKSAQIIRLFQQEGIDVIPVMTQNARHFIGPLTLNKLSGYPISLDPFQAGSGEIEHISLARESDLFLVAPATANILAKFAAGIADDFVSTIFLSTSTPVLVAPAMNVEMWRNPATLKNVETLKERGVRFIGPDSGYQACGEVGEGRLADPEVIVETALCLLKPEQTLNNIRVLVTAGPTIEDIDPVRFISNRSSGKMGYAIAGEARLRGADVTLVTGPTKIEVPEGVELLRIRSASEMMDQVLKVAGHSDVIIKAAAVADMTPKKYSDRKIKKTGDQTSFQLVPTQDILLKLAQEKREGQILVGFAAESENLSENAKLKLKQKKLDLIVANNITGEHSAFDSEHNEVLLIDRNLEEARLTRMTKTRVAKQLWDKIEELLVDPKSPQIIR